MKFDDRRSILASIFLFSGVSIVFGRVHTQLIIIINRWRSLAAGTMLG